MVKVFHIDFGLYVDCHFLCICRFKPNEGVIVIGATNFAEALDK